MRILLIKPHPFYIDRGTPIDVDNLLQAFSQRGDQVDLVCYHEGEDRHYENVTIHRIRPPLSGRKIGAGFSFLKVFFDFYVFARSWKLVRSRRYDGIHANEEAAFFAMLLSRFYRIPYVYDMDSSVAQQMVEQKTFLKPLSSLLNALEGRAVRKDLAVAPVCNALADLARSNGARRVVTLHDISRLDLRQLNGNGALRQKLGLASDRLILMYVGNLNTYQGLDLLLASLPHAFRSGAEVDVVIAGGTEQNIQRYRQKAAGLNLSDRVHWIGPWPSSRLDELLSQADILTAPRTKGINTPMKVFPYMHSGKPLLVMDLPTHPQILDDSVVMLASTDPERFGQAIVRLASDQQLRERIGQAGQRFVELNHTFDSHKKRVDELYDYVQASCRNARSDEHVHAN